MNPEIVVVGSSNTDMVVKIPALPSPGETVLGGDFVVAAGGKGANQAVAAARLGSSVGFVACIGRDMFGDQSLENLRKDQILTDFVVRDSVRPSGVALIMVDEGGENMIAVASGANSGLLPEDVEAAEHLIGDSRVVVLQLEIPLDVVQCAAQLGVRAGCTVILNPAPAQPLEREMLCSISILTPNEKETASLTGIEPKDDVTSRAAAQKLRASGVDSVVITMGKKGAYLLSEKDEGLIQAPKVQPKDTTAAGDAFNGALAHAIARGVDLPAAIDFANHAAALSVTRLGAQSSLPTLEEISKEFPALSVF